MNTFILYYKYVFELMDDDEKEDVHTSDYYYNNSLKGHRVIVSIPRNSNLATTDRRHDKVFHI